MKFQITGKQIDIGEALQTHVKDELGAIVDKYAGRATDANVYFSKSAHMHNCEATVHLSSGITCQAGGSAPEIYAAFEDSLDKMEKQLRRYKRRLKDHHRDRPDPVEVMEAVSYILSSNPEAGDAAEEEEPTPVIVAEMETKVPTLSVSDAVMQMELAHAKVLVFRNEKHDGVNVVYRRDDGNIGWIDPRNAK